MTKMAELEKKGDKSVPKGSRAGHRISARDTVLHESRTRGSGCWETARASS